MANKWITKTDKFKQICADIPTDYERAHIAQDKIYREFIKAVAGGKFRTITDARVMFRMAKHRGRQNYRACGHY